MAVKCVRNLVAAGAVTLLGALPVHAADAGSAGQVAARSMFSLTSDGGKYDSSFVRVDFPKADGSDYRIGLVRGVGATFGVSRHSRLDAGYSVGRKLMVAGPTVSWNVPGHLSTSLLLLNESATRDGGLSALSPLERRRGHDIHPMLSASWDISVSRRWSFEGLANVIGLRGRDEAGYDGGAETNVDLQLMYDAGAALGRKKDMFRIGIEYQYSNNKYGTSVYRMGTQGLRPRTPMLRADFQF
ncbi:MAG: outer envelope protein [Pseudomonadota bacterium]